MEVSRVGYYDSLKSLLHVITPPPADPKPTILQRLHRRISTRSKPPHPSSRTPPSPKYTISPPPPSTSPSPAPTLSTPTPTPPPFTHDPSLPTPILTLPNELLLLTFTFLSPPSLASLALTNKRFHTLLSPLCLHSLDCSLKALCYAVVTANEPLMHILLSKQGPGFVLSSATQVVFPTEKEYLRCVGMFVLGPKLRVGVGQWELGTVRELAEGGRWGRVLSYCWCTDEKRGEVWEGIVKRGL